jgi:hypothetical protein
VTPQILQKTWCEIEYRLAILWAKIGAHIEMYWTWCVVGSMWFWTSYIFLYSKKH